MRVCVRIVLCVCVCVCVHVYVVYEDTNLYNDKFVIVKFDSLL